MNQHIVYIMVIGLGGALGTLFRYLINAHLLFVDYPLGTVIENLIGSLLLGLLTGWVVFKKMKEWIRLSIGVGFCGGFTTMSTFAADTLYLQLHFNTFHTLLYILLSLFGGLLLAFIGFLLGMKWANSAMLEGNEVEPE